MNIVITGASNGIGYQTALELTKQKHRVFAIARNKNNLEKLRNAAEKINSQSQLHTIAADITEEESINEIEREISAHARTLQVLINNAGTLINKPFDELTSEEWFNVYKTNVFAPVNLIRRLLPFLSPLSSGEGSVVRPHILNISSMGGFQGSIKFKGLSAYSSSKAAVVNLTECLAEEFKDRNIAVNCLCLGSVQTEMFSAAFPKFNAATTTEEIATFIAQFAIEGQKLFNGKVLPVSSSTP